jgi:cell division protein FtsZ
VSRVIDDYLARLARGMQANRVGRAAVLDEVREHLLDAAAGLEARGVPRARALNRAIARFGAPGELAAQFVPDGGWGPPPRRVVVVGGGGVGARAAADLATMSRVGVEALAVDMRAALDDVPLDRQLVVGGGVGPSFRRFLHSVRYRMAEQDSEAIRAEVDGAEAVVVVVALGDPAGAGAAPLVARVAAATGALTVAAAVRPAGDEASDVRRAGRLGESGLLTYADAVVVLDEHRLLFPLVSARPPWGRHQVGLGERAVAVVAVPPSGVAVEPAPMAQVRAMSAAVLRHAADAVVSLLTGEAGPGRTKEPRALLAGAGVLSFGVGRAEGNGSVAAATRAAFASPPMELQRDRVDRVLCCLTGSGLDADAAREAAGAITDVVGAEADVAVAAVTDRGWVGRTRSVVLADQRAAVPGG